MRFPLAVHLLASCRSSTIDFGPPGPAVLPVFVANMPGSGTIEKTRKSKGIVLFSCRLIEKLAQKAASASSSLITRSFHIVIRHCRMFDKAVSVTIIVP